MKAIKAGLLVLLAAAMIGWGWRVPATHNVGPLPPKESGVIVNSQCGGSIVKKEPGRYLIVTAEHCLRGDTAQIHARGWKYLGDADEFTATGDLSWLWLVTDQDLQVAEIGPTPTPGDILWWRAYNFGIKEWTPVVGVLTDEVSEWDGQTFPLVYGVAVRGFSGTGVYANGKLIGVVSIGIFPLGNPQGPWMGYSPIERYPDGIVANEEAQEGLAQAILSIMREYGLIPVRVDLGA